MLLVYILHSLSNKHRTDTCLILSSSLHVFTPWNCSNAEKKLKIPHQSPANSLQSPSTAACYLEHNRHSPCSYLNNGQMTRSTETHSSHGCSRAPGCSIILSCCGYSCSQHSWLNPGRLSRYYCSVNINVICNQTSNLMQLLHPSWALFGVCCSDIWKTHTLLMTFRQTATKGIHPVTQRKWKTSFYKMVQHLLGSPKQYVWMIYFILVWEALKMIWCLSCIWAKLLNPGMRHPTLSMFIDTAKKNESGEWPQPNCLIWWGRTTGALYLW